LSDEVLAESWELLREVDDERDTRRTTFLWDKTFFVMSQSSSHPKHSAAVDRCLYLLGVILQVLETSPPPPAPQPPSLAESVAELAQVHPSVLSASDLHTMGPLRHAIHRHLSRASGGLDGDLVCSWLWAMYRTSVGDVQRFVLDFIPVLLSTYLLGGVREEGGAQAGGPLSCPAIEALLIGLANAEALRRDGMPDTVTPCDLSRPSVYHQPGFGLAGDIPSSLGAAVGASSSSSASYAPGPQAGAGSAATTAADLPSVSLTSSLQQQQQQQHQPHSQPPRPVFVGLALPLIKTVTASNRPVMTLAILKSLNAQLAHLSVEAKTELCNLSSRLASAGCRELLRDERLPKSCVLERDLPTRCPVMACRQVWGELVRGLLFCLHCPKEEEREALIVPAKSALAVLRARAELEMDPATILLMDAAVNTATRASGSIPNSEEDQTKV
jgi:hypothetical protein